MKTLVAYYSQTGNTKKIADAIYDTLYEEKTLMGIDEIDDASTFDVIFIGFPIHKMGMPEKVKSFIMDNMQNKKIVLFTTHAALPDSDLLKPLFEKCKDMMAGSKLLGLFHCRGELSEEVTKVMLKSDNPNIRNFAGMRPMTIGHPDASEINEAVLFTKGIMKKYSDSQ
ncbi:MAG: flavodoxin [Desulfobacteraceae bacterium]|nr:flavodoxin [Desulfobacteraceae bacterium]